MDDATRALMAQIDALSISESDPSLDTTIVGIGSLSGRALMAFGELALRGVESVNLRMKLRTLASQLAQQETSEVPDATYDVVLELQRAGLYSDSIRFSAWNLILGQMELGQTEGLVRGILRWPWIEIEVFIRQLALTRSRNWTIYPGSVVERQARSNISDSIRKDIAATTTESYRRMLKAILFHYNSPLDVEKTVVIEDQDLDSIILCLPRHELEAILDSLVQRSLSEIRQFIQQVFMSQLHAGKLYTQEIKTVDRVLAAFSTFWRCEPNLMRAIVKLDQIIPFLSADLDVPLDEDTLPHDMSYCYSLVALAGRIRNPADLDRDIFVLALATEPIILMLPGHSMQKFIAAFNTLSQSQMEPYLRAVVLSKQPTWSQYPEKLTKRIVENLVELFEALRHHPNPDAEAIFPFNSLLKFIPESVMSHPDQPVLRALLRHATTTDDLDLLGPIIVAHPEPGVIHWIDGVRALIRILLEGDKHITEIRQYLQRFVFTRMFQTSIMAKRDTDGDADENLDENIMALAVALWRKDPSYVDDILRTEWITALYSSIRVRDPTHKIFQVVLRHSQEQSTRNSVMPQFKTIARQETAATGIWELFDVCTASEAELCLSQLILWKAIQWSERVEAEAVVEDVLNLVVRVWKRHRTVVYALLDRIDAEALSISIYSKTVKNIGQCILIALLNELDQMSDLRDLVPLVRRERTPVILLVSAGRLRKLTGILSEDRAEIKTYLELVLSKLPACAHQPLHVRQRIVKNLLEFVSSIWRPELQVECSVELGTSLGWIIDSFPTRPTPTEHLTNQFMLFMKCISPNADSPLVAEIPFDDAIQRLMDISEESSPLNLSLNHDEAKPLTPNIVSNGHLEASVWISLRAVSYHLSTSKSLELTHSAVYDALLNLRRDYPREAIQHAIWDVILLEMGRGSIKNLVASLLRRPDNEIGIFLRQLKEAKSNQWTVYPGTSTPRAFVAPPSTRSKSEDGNNGTPLASGSEVCAAESFFQLLLTMLEMNSAVVHANLSWDDILESVNKNGGSDSRIMHSPVSDTEVLSATLSPPTELLCCTRYLKTGTNMRTAAFSLTTYSELISTLHMVLPRLNGDGKASLDEAIETAVTENLNVRFPKLRYGGSYLSSLDAVLFCLLLVYMWGYQHNDKARHVPQSLVEHLSHNKKITTEMLEWPYCDDSFQMNTWATLYILEYLTLSGNGLSGGIAKLHWIRLLIVFNGSFDWIDDITLAKAYGVILCCAASSEAQWGPLMEAMQHDTSAPSVASMIRQFRSWSTDIPRALVRRLYVRAKLRGSEVVNPINRFILLLREASRRASTVKRALRRYARSESLKLVRDVKRGAFDDLGWPTEVERTIRDEACKELTSLIEAQTAT